MFDCFQYPYECKTKNLSKPSDLTLTVESQRREGRRGYDSESSSSQLFPSSPFPFPLPSLPLLPPPPGHLRPKMRDSDSLDSLASPPGPPGLLPPGFSPVDVTRLTLMKMMGGSHGLPFLPPPFPSSDSASSQETTESQTRPGKKESDRNRREDQTETSREEEEKNKLVVCIEVNSVKYQGILFAQSDKNKDCRQ